VTAASKPVRAFLAFEIPESIKAELAAGRELLQAELPRARWVRPEGQHLTLKFLGEVSRAVLDDLVGELTPSLEPVPRVTVQLTGAGFFPSPARPRVAWVGGRADGADAVVKVIEDAADARGFARERRPWSLHLTQARLNRGWPREAVERFCRWGEGLDLEPFVAVEVVLFSSSLRPTGAVYTALERMPLC
jgi:2'-5' RNA ligase